MLSINPLAGRNYPKHAPWATLARKILGPKYDLSLVFARESLARELNWRYRKKKYSPNVLSFSLGPSAGEIFLNPSVARREAKSFGQTFENHLVYLFIHGALHLKGFRHGSKMNKKEKEFSQHFTISNVKANHLRARHRHEHH